MEGEGGREGGMEGGREGERERGRDGGREGGKRGRKGGREEREGGREGGREEGRDGREEGVDMSSLVIGEGSTCKDLPLLFLPVPCSEFFHDSIPLLLRHVSVHGGHSKVGLSHLLCQPLHLCEVRGGRTVRGAVGGRRRMVREKEKEGKRGRDGEREREDGKERRHVKRG